MLLPFFGSNGYVGKQVVGGAVWLATLPACGLDHIHQVPIGSGKPLHNFLPLAEPLCGFAVRLVAHATRKFGWLRSRPAALTTYSRRPIGQHKPPNFCSCYWQAVSSKAGKKGSVARLPACGRDQAHLVPAGVEEHPRFCFFDRRAVLRGQIANIHHAHRENRAVALVASKFG